MTEASTDKLVQDLRVVLEDAEALLSATAGQAGERVQEARARVEQSLREVRDRLAASQQELETRVRDAATEADQYIRENPWQAVGIAAGAAFILGLLISRR